MTQTSNSARISESSVTDPKNVAKLRSSVEESQVSPHCFRLPNKDRLRTMAKQYSTAKPFPHIVVDNFLSETITVKDVGFPDLSWAGWSQFHDGYQFGKRHCNNLEKFPELLRAMIIEASQPRFLSFLENLTGICGLIPDPYLNGGGLHSSGPGGILVPHTDFHIYDRLGLYRRINLLIYFNEGWEESNGGALELSEKGASAISKSILPIFGRVVIFNTDDTSVHGFTKPVAQGMRRDSLALYYYTSHEVGSFSGDRTTYWQQHGEGNALRSLKLSTYKTLLLGSRILSKVAHMVNPNFESSVKKGITDE
jgi:2OG-Fe(II) oxygenase superfamily